MPTKALHHGARTQNKAHTAVGMKAKRQALLELMREELLTVAEVAAELKLSPAAVRNLIYRAQLQALRMGERRLRVTRPALDQYRATQLRPV